MALVSQLLRFPPELKLEVEAAASAAGMSASTWLRQAATAALGRAGSRPAAAASDPVSVGGERRLHLRVPASDVARWKVEALEHGVTLNRYVQLQLSVTPERGRRVAAAVETLGDASVEFARLGRNLNQVARSINTFPGQTTASQRRTVMEACKSAGSFADQITAVCGELNLKLGRRRRKPAREVLETEAVE